jgi:Glycosyltransferase like family
LISWIVASHDERILNENLLRTLTVSEEDELVLIKDAPSITWAYEEGQQLATRPVHCFIHHDIKIINQALLRQYLISDTEKHDLCGLVGSTTLAVPWSNGSVLGSVGDSRLGTLNFGKGGECLLLDGLLLASRNHLPWDTSWTGWHGYDYDICMQVKAAGGSVWCMDFGAAMVVHNSDSPFIEAQIDGWPQAEARFYEKWHASL